MRRVSRDPFAGSRARVDAPRMDVAAATPIYVEAMALSNARQPLEAAQRNPLPADAPVEQQAAVVLQLSAAAQQLLQ
jgi:hypothetical protein